MKSIVWVTLFYLALGVTSHAHAEDAVAVEIELDCPAQETVCYLIKDGQSMVVPHDVLPVLVPMADDTTNCFLEVCYDEDYNVLGLNPDYYLWEQE